ncbi:IS3 family transposase [Lysinibacter sp. HNR]|uniref:IS3 family transposase n=1 Tax=Lysinibacter sp. HNR TaxID=3031408 RepID=UPI00243539A9|nr:IS3 family transposase [Lysinibacter sp. HNR]WGD37753.1 IS3 family transposase [Lysinibacter sp. HNR]
MASRLGSCPWFPYDSGEPVEFTQYGHPLWQETLREAGLTQSMSRKGNCLDYAVIEGFFSHMKEEWFRIQQPQTLPEFYAGFNEYLGWWNTTQIQARLGHLSPDQYRNQLSTTG